MGSGCYPAGWGWGKERKGLRTLQSQFLPKLLSGHQRRERKGLVLESQEEELWSTPAHPHTSAASHPVQMPHPPL